MSVAENNDEDELDIYSNLPNFHYDDTILKLETKNELLLKTISELEKKISTLSVDLSECKKAKAQLEKNISSLYKSAKQEIIRKDKRISELSLREISYKVGGRYSAKQNVPEQHEFKDESSKNRRNSYESKYESKISKPNDTESKEESSRSNRNDRRSKDERDTSKRIDRRSKSYRDDIKNEEDQKKPSTSLCHHSYRTRYQTRKEESADSSAVQTTKGSACKSGSVNKRSPRKSNEISSDGKNSSPRKRKIKIFSPKSNLPEPLLESVVLNEFPDYDDSASKNVEDELQHSENYIPLVESDPLVEESYPQLPVLPVFHGPRTMFSMRQYKKLYGASPLKEPCSVQRLTPLSISSDKKSAGGKISRHITGSVAADVKRKLLVGDSACDKRFSKKSELNNLELSTNCDSIDSEKSRLIDNLELQRKVSVRVKTVEESIVSSSINCGSDRSLNAVDEVSSCNNLVIAKPCTAEGETTGRGTTACLDNISNLHSSMSGDREFKSVQPGNIEVVYIESLDYNAGLNIQTSEFAESFKCNNLPLTGDTIDLLITQEEVEVVTDNVEIQNISNLSGGNEDQNSKLTNKVDQEVDISGDDKEKIKDATNGSGHKDGNESMKCDSVDVEPQKRNVSKDVCDISGDSYDSYTLELTNSPSPVDELVAKNNIEPRVESCKTDTANALEIPVNKSLTPNKISKSPVKSRNVSPRKITTQCKKSAKALSEFDSVSKQMNVERDKSKTLIQDLFGDSPTKSNDSVFCSNQRVKNSLNTFTSAEPIVSEGQTKKDNDVSLPVLENKNVLDLGSIAVQKSDNILVVPDVSKSYSNFQEAFHHEKLENIKSLDAGRGLCALDNKLNLSDNNVNKENPASLTSVKSSNLPSPDIKHILCDKRLNDSNISSMNEKQNDLQHKAHEDNVKINKDNIHSSDSFNDGLKEKRSFADLKLSNSKTDLNTKMNENSFLMPGDDSAALCAINKYTKIGDTVTPIKTPFKDFGTNNFDTRTETNLSRFSDNSLFNETSTFSMIKHYSKIGELVTPIKTPCKVNDAETRDSQSVSVVKCNENVSNTTLMNKTENVTVTPMVIKKDGISICMSSEHCEFKRERRIKKIIKFNTGAKTSTKVDATKESAESDHQIPLNVSQETAKRKIEESNDWKTESSTRKKRRIVITNKIPATKIVLRPNSKKRDSINQESNNRSMKSTSKIERSKLHSSKITAEIKSRGKKHLRASSVTSFRRHKSVDRNVKKRSKCVKKSNFNEQQTNDLPNKFRNDIKRNLSVNNGVCERRSPSEYFNKQQRSRLTIERNCNRRVGIRRSLKLKSPTPVPSYRKRKMIERRSSTEMRPSFRKIRVENNKVEFIKNMQKANRLSNSEDDRNVMLKSLYQSPNKNACLPVKRLSESPNVRIEMPAASSRSPAPTGLNKNVVREFMKWKPVPLEIDKVSSGLVKRFINDKKLPGYVKESKVDTINSPSNPVDISKDEPTSSKTSPLSHSVIIRRRIRRVGERKLEDSPVLTSNVSCTTVKEPEKVVENPCSKSEEDQITLKVNEQEQTVKRKQTIQKTRCIVKTPLDFKNKFSAVNDDLESSECSSEESQISDESWRPKKSYKKRNRR